MHEHMEAMMKRGDIVVRRCDGEKMVVIGTVNKCYGEQKQNVSNQSGSQQFFQGQQNMNYNSQQNIVECEVETAWLDNTGNLNNKSFQVNELAVYN